MLFVKKHEKEKISNVVICFSLFAVSIFIQTSYMHLGTITAAATILLTIGAFLLKQNFAKVNIYFNIYVALLLLFFLYTMIGCFFAGIFPSYYTRFVAQILLCMLLFSVDITEKENEYLKKVFVLFTTIYAVLVIMSCIENAREGYARNDIILFGVELDPNFVGLSLVAAMTLLLDNFLNKKKMVLSAAMYLVNAVAIVYTASRGSFFTAIISSVLVFSFFLFNKKIRPLRKLFYFVLVIVLVWVLISTIKVSFPLQWERMMTIGQKGSDNGRIDLWQNAILWWMENPIFGGGLYSNYLNFGMATHNTYLQLLSATGLIGFGIGASFFVLMLKKAYNYEKGLFCMLCGILIQIFFLDALDARVFWVVLCWIAMLPNEKKYRENENAKISD